MEEILQTLKDTGFILEEEYLKEIKLSLCSIRAIRSEGGTCRWTEDSGRLSQLKIVLSVRIKNVSDKIDYIEDHVGILTVHWKAMPMPFEKKIVKEIWTMFGEDSVYHELITRTQID